MQLINNKTPEEIDIFLQGIECKFFGQDPYFKSSSAAEKLELTLDEIWQELEIEPTEYLKEGDLYSLAMISKSNKATRFMKYLCGKLTETPAVLDKALDIIEGQENKLCKQ